MEDLLARLGIADFAARHIRSLSGGQQQRVFLARALIRRPDFDRPVLVLLNARNDDLGKRLDRRLPNVIVRIVRPNVRDRRASAKNPVPHLSSTRECAVPDRVPPHDKAIPLPPP